MISMIQDEAVKKKKKKKRSRASLRADRTDQSVKRKGTGKKSLKQKQTGTKESTRRIPDSEVRRRRRKRKRRAKLMKRLTVAAAVIGVAGIGFGIVWNLPEIKLERALYSAEQYVEAASFEEALISCEDALKIDSTSVSAYRTMAGTYLNMEEEVQAKQVLYEGWENTNDESLFHYYLTLILNEGVEDINSENCTLDTAGKFLTVLEEEPDNADALSLMDTAYDWIAAAVKNDSLTYFCDSQAGAEACFFPQYEEIMNRILTLAEKNGSEAIKQLAGKYAVFEAEELPMNREHLDSYYRILSRVTELSSNEKADALMACLKKEAQIQELFAPVFAEFDAGNMAAAKDFIVTEQYTSLRDEFINGSVAYWNGATYIPVSREQVTLRLQDGAWTFEYPDFKQREDTAGVITVYGNKMTDEGIQRSCIGYEPPKTTENYYPHTEYVVSYMFSNVQKKSAFEGEMNYHLETKTWTESGMTTVMVGDWGGPYEWSKSY